jgi:MerR family transcriptional regulator, repressor of the yfmOP operon
MNTTPATVTAKPGRPRRPAGGRPERTARGGPGVVPRASTAKPGRPTAEDGRLLGIGAAAARAGVSERALRYYQELGLIVPTGTTPGGLRRYSEENLARVARIRELQTVLGLNLDEIAIVLRNEDRLAEIRQAYKDQRTSDDERLRLTRECLVLLEGLRITVEGKRAALESFLADLEARIGRAQDVLADLAGLRS